jgi:uncharacterized phage protein (TIGR01671 family)
MSSPRKFRVWDGEKMHEPPHEYIYDPRDGARRVIGASDGRLTCSQPIDGEVMFATGLTDAEGNEIWEGDVIQDKYGNAGVVKWAEGGSCWVMAIYRAPNQTTAQQKLTVIGNRHENPELLEGSTT